MSADEHVRRDVMASWQDPPVIPGSPTAYCRDCASSGVGCCDAYPNCPAGRAQHTSTPRLVLSELTLSAVQAEATRAHLLHREHSMFGQHLTNQDRYLILAEEAGEVAHELCEASLSGTLDRDALVKELVQVAAMAASWVEAIEGGSR